MFDWMLRRGPQKADAEVKASAAGRVAALGGAGRVVWSPRDVASLTKAGFTGNPVGFRAVKLIAEAAAAIPVIVQETGQRYDTHPVQALLARPNVGQGRAELFEALFGQLLLTGNGYLEAAGAADGLPVELHVLRSDRMSVVPGADGWAVAYEYAVGGRKHRFAVTEGQSPICHIKSFHPQDDHFVAARAPACGGDGGRPEQCDAGGVPGRSQYAGHRQRSGGWLGGDPVPDGHSGDGRLPAEWSFAGVEGQLGRNARQLARGIARGAAGWQAAPVGAAECGAGDGTAFPLWPCRNADDGCKLSLSGPHL